MTRTIRTAIVGAAIAATATLGACAQAPAPGTAPATTVTATATVTVGNATATATATATRTAEVLVPCEVEDGSTPGQAFPCRWDATLQGNGRGESYTLTHAG